MIKMKVPIVGGIQMEVEVQNVKDAFQSLSFWLSLPKVCPHDGKPTVLRHRNIKDNDYYVVATTGPVPYEHKLGVSKDGKGLIFYEDRPWQYWNGKEIIEVPDPKEPVAPKATAGKPAPTAVSDYLTEEEVKDLKGACFAAGVTTRDEMNKFLTKIGRKPNDWSNFTGEESARLLTVINDEYAPEPPDDLF